MRFRKERIQLGRLRIAYLCDSNFKFDSRPQKEVRSLLKNGYEVLVLDWDRTGNGRIGKELCSFHGIDVVLNHIAVRGVNGGTLQNMAFVMIRYEAELIRWLIRKKGDYDLIYACNLNTAVSACMIARLFGKRMIYDIFDYYVDCHSYTGKGSPLRGIMERLDRSIINRADAVIICSEKRREQIKKASPRLLAIIHNSPENRQYETGAYKELYHFSRDKVKIAYIGYLEPGRPIKLLAQIAARDQRLEFHCAGYGPDAAIIERMAQEHANLYFYGKVCYDEAIFIEENCDIIPALYNPQLKNHQYSAPNKFYEALMLGKPILAIQNTGIDEMVLEYRLGEVCECNLLSIQTAIDTLIQKRDGWDEIKRISRRIYQEKFSWDTMEKRLIQLIEKAAAGSGEKNECNVS